MYRSDIDAMEARLRALDAEVADRMRARDQAAQMLAEARARAQMSGLAADWAAGGPQARRRKKAKLVTACVLGAMAASALTVGIVRHYMHTGERGEKLMAQFEQFTDQLCECKDKQCAQAVTDTMTKWSVDLSKEQPNPPPLSEEQMKRATVLGERMGKCMTDAMTRETPAETSRDQAPQQYQSQAGGR